MSYKWEETELLSDYGKLIKAVSPLIISASRSTDIPAFYSEWLVNRLQKGYVKWINPFNSSKPQYISFDKIRLIVFWTKNAKPIIPFLSTFDAKNINYYFQFTLNDYEKEGFEPNVPFLKDRIKTFMRLSNQIGKEKVIWRFDPLILSDSISVRELLKKIWELGKELVYYTDKLVFSFVDILQYRKVVNNFLRNNPSFNKNNISSAEFDANKKIEFAEGIQKILFEWKKINPKFRIATCSEDIDLDKLEIHHNKCIDDELIINLFKADNVLMRFLGYDESFTDLFNSEYSYNRPNLKDKGQRKECGCIVSKDIGAYNTCRHLCIYCYANTSANAVEKNFKRINNYSESLIPNSDF